MIIKLSMKSKRILLTLLVIVSIGIIGYEYITNKNIKKDIADKQEEFIENTSGEKNEDSILENENESNNIKDIKSYTDKENKLYNEAYTLFFSKEYENAINKAEELINEFPYNPMGYNIRGIAKSYNGDYEGGMKDINKSLEIDPAYGYARFNKALTYELYGDLYNALEWYNKAVEVEEYVWSYYGIASIYGRKGDVSNTMKYLNKAIEIDSVVKKEAKIESDFDPVRDSSEFQKVINN